MAQDQPNTGVAYGNPLGLPMEGTTPQAMADAAKTFGEGLWQVLGQPIVNTLRYPGDVLSGKYTLGQIEQKTPSFALSLALAGAGVPKPPGALGIMAGRLAQEADIGSMRRADSAELMNQMAADKGRGLPAGEMRQRIFDKTGWYRGADGSWRFVIPDSEAGLKESGLIAQEDYFRPVYDEAGHSVPNAWTVKAHTGEPNSINNHTTRQDLEFDPEEDQINTVGNLLSHKELFDNYPGLKDVPVIRLPSSMAERGVQGQTSWTVDGPMIELGQFDSKEDLLSTLLHEVQHVVQRFEGHEGGGNISQFLPTDRVPTQADRLEAYNKYLRVRGEVEARLVQEQRRLGDYSRLPERYEGYIPEAQQLQGEIMSRLKGTFGPYSLETVDYDPFEGPSK